MAANPPRRLNRLTEPLVLLPALAAVMLVVIWGTTFDIVGLEREAARRAASATTVELVETYEAQVVRALREIDQTLKLVAYAHQQSGAGADLAQLRKQGLLPPELIFVVRIADARGRIVAANRGGEAEDVAGEDFFETQRADGRLVIGRPKWNDALQEWRLHFSRRLSGWANQFDGVAVVSVPASYFVSGYEASKLGQMGVLGLLGADGVFRARRTGEQFSAGEGTDYRAVVPANPEAGAALAANAWDKVPRYTAARELFDAPLAVIVGLSDNEQMAPVEARVETYLWRAGYGSALLLFIVSVLCAMSWRAARFRRAAEATLNLRKRAIESSVNAILLMVNSEAGPSIEYVNPAFEGMTGYSAREANDRDFAFLLGQEADQPGVQEVRKALREEQEGHAVLRCCRKDGTVFWIEFYVAPVRGDQGGVSHYVGIMNDVTEAKMYEAQLAHRANFDPLTGLANRNLVQDRLQQAIANARRIGGSVIVVFLDIDYFKVVNDGMGHQLGDELLRVVSTRLKGCVRESDTVARMGGDEFVLVLHDKSDAARTVEANVSALLSKVLEQVAQPLTLGDREIRPGCSMGVSIGPQDGADAGTLLRNADGAMYRAKELGRGRFQFFTADVHDRIQRRMELETSLRRALERGELELAYQPQVGMRNGMIVGAEALIRWRHPQRGLIGPAQFIPFAEETGLIVDIGEWVLRTACAQNKAWQERGLPPIPVAVNISARQCAQPDIDRVVRKALADSGLDPQFLELEITESMSMADPEQSVPLLTRLKETGVTLSIDDFGTGFSSLSYLRRFPVDRLKIDLSFVREITSDPGSLAISEAIITMSHSLNLEVIAEGVETEGQLELLGERHCDLMQGYLFSPPLAAADFERLLAEDRRLPVRPGAHERPRALLM